MALVALAAGGSTPAAASGAWTTFLRASTYYDLLAEGDTVWCATGEAGLLRYDRRDSSFVAITREPNGLASNSLSALLRDQQGRLWVGTLGAGASRLSADGKKWDVVNRFDGLPSDSVTAFAQRGDTLLIGTTRGIALWNGVEVTGALPDGFNPSPFTAGSDWITGIVIHGDVVWVSTQIGVYWSRFSLGLTRENWTLETQFIYSDRAFQGIAADDTTVIALSIDTPFVHGLNPGGPWSFAKTLAGGGQVPPPVRVSSDYGQVLLTTEQGFYKWDARNGWLRITNQFTSDRDDDRRSFALGVDASGRYVAADHNGLRQRMGDPDLWALRAPSGPPGNNVTNVAVDGKRRLWVNTFDSGIGRYDGQQWRIWPFGIQCGTGCDTTFYDPRYALGLLVDGRDKKWFGCWSIAIDVYDDSLDTPVATHHRYLPPLVNAERHTCAWASVSDPSGGRWFGMDTNNSDFNPIGIEYYDATGTYAANFSPDSSTVRGAKVHALTVDRAGRLWVGYTGQGIDIFDISHLAPPYTLPAPITVLASDRYDVQGLVAHGDTVWALTTSELVAYRQSISTSTTNGRIVSYSIPAGPGGVSINPLAVSRDGAVWVGTVSGIRMVDPYGNVQDFDTSNSPLPDNEIRAIRVDWETGVVWIGTARGLVRYDPGYRPPPPPAVPELKITIYPNPAWVSSVGIGIKIDGNATSYFGEVYDLRGRRLRKFSGVGNQGVVWDGRTDQGDLVRPGMYFFRVESGGKSATSRVILLR